MPKLWRIAAHDPERIAALERAAGIPAVVAQLLLARGIHDAELARQFLEPKLTALRDPELLPGVAAAADLLLDAVRIQAANHRLRRLRRRRHDRHSDPGALPAAGGCGR